MLFPVMVFCCLVLTRAQYRGITRTTNCNNNYCEENVSVHGSNDPFSGDSFRAQPPYYPPIRNTNDAFRNSNPIGNPRYPVNQQGPFYDNYESNGDGSHSVSERRYSSSFNVVSRPEDDPVYQGFQRTFTSNQFGMSCIDDANGIFSQCASSTSTMVSSNKQSNNLPTIGSDPNRDRNPSDLNPFRNRHERPFIGTQYDDPTNNNRNNPSITPGLRPQKTEVPNQCTTSKTRINGGQTVCTGALLFEDHFNKGQLNTSKWQREQYVADEPDNEFVTYEKRAQNCFIKNMVLHLKTILREDPTVTKIDLTNGCTGKLCSVAVNEQKKILPPIVAGKIKSMFSFLYGKIEIRAQLPKGDWIYPQVNLEPSGWFSYDAGRLWVAYARGNTDLKRQETGEQIGNSVLYAGGVLGQAEPARTYAALRIPAQRNWGDDFHVYTLIWAPDGINILVDGDDKGHISPPYTNSNSSNPFNEEYVISLGIAAGGFSDFPEGSTSNGTRKPWKRLSVRPVVNFYESRNQWYPTWDGDNSALKVDYVKVWAL